MRKMTAILMSCLLIAAGCSGNNSEERSGSGTGGPGPQGAQRTDAAAGSEPPAAMPAPDPNKKSTVVFSMFKEDPYIQDAKKAYEKKHPNITIDLRTVVKDGRDDISGVKLENYKSTMIADFLNGKGPDMIVTDSLPASKYIAKGLLADVGRMMNGDPAFHKEQYFQNILDSLKNSDGGLYAMPLSFSLTALMGDQETLEQTGVKFDDKTWTWNEFIDAAKEMSSKPNGSRYALFAFDQNLLLFDMIRTSYSRLVDPANRKAHFDSEFFIRMMEQIKAMEDDKVVAFASTVGGKLSGFDKVYFEERELLTPYQYFGFIADMKENGYKKPKFYEKPKAEGQEPGGYFVPRINIAINAKSSVQPEAWDFLKFLMSGEASAAASWGPDDLTYEGQGYNGTFPISRAVYEAKTKKLLEAGELHTFTGEGAIQVTQEDVQQLESILLQANKPLFNNEIMGELYKESPAFFSGQKSAQAVANIFQNKATTYLNE